MMIILVVMMTSEMAMPMASVTVIMVVVLRIILPSPMKAVFSYKLIERITQ